jgi:hypothetical protein
VTATCPESNRIEGPLAARDTAILARWPGRCPYCARPIKRGDLIVQVAGQWLHDDCDQAAKDADQ